MHLSISHPSHWMRYTVYKPPQTPSNPKLTLHNLPTTVTPPPPPAPNNVSLEALTNHSGKAHPVCPFAPPNGSNGTINVDWLWRHVVS